jgi:octaprenyl-diphosphate synthase
MTATVHSLQEKRAPSLEPMMALTATGMNAVNAVILERMQSKVALIPELAGHLIAGGGKRMRPMLTLACAALLGYPGTRHHKLAAAVEFIHTATLLHDDVVDESGLRRGRRTANAMFGNAASVLVGDFVYSRAFQMMVSVNRMRVLDVLADATNVIAEGEVLQLMNAHDPETTEQRYLEVIYRKTGRLFEAGAEVSAVLAGVSIAQQAALARYGKHLGIAYQLIDDVLDYKSDPATRGKNLGDDLAEGKPTLPLLHALRHGNDEQRALIRLAIEQGGLAQLGPIVEAIEVTGGLDYAIGFAQRETAQALAALDALADTPYSRALAALAGFAQDRTS